VEVNSTGGQGSHRAVASSDDDDITMLIVKYVAEFELYIISRIRRSRLLARKMETRNAHKILALKHAGGAPHG
jgi:hypothetical protein